jgi:hypothetical protein
MDPRDPNPPGGKLPFETQDSNPDAWVGVRAGFHNDTGTPVTDILIQGKQTGEHIHIGIDEHGNQAFGPNV